MWGALCLVDWECACGTGAHNTHNHYCYNTHTCTPPRHSYILGHGSHTLHMHTTISNTTTAYRLFPSHSQPPPQGIKFYDPQIVGNTPETVEYLGMQNLVAAVQSHLGLTKGRVVFDPTNKEVLVMGIPVGEIHEGGVHAPTTRTKPPLHIHTCTLFSPSSPSPSSPSPSSPSASSCFPLSPHADGRGMGRPG